MWTPTRTFSRFESALDRGSIVVLVAPNSDDDVSQSDGLDSPRTVINRKRPQVLRPGGRTSRAWSMDRVLLQNSDEAAGLTRSELENKIEEAASRPFWWSAGLPGTQQRSLAHRLGRLRCKTRRCQIACLLLATRLLFCATNTGKGSRHTETKLASDKTLPHPQQCMSLGFCSPVGNG